MEISFSLPHVFHPGSPQVEDSEVLKTLLDALIKINLSFWRRHTPKPLYESGVYYARTSIWDPIPALYKKGYGDCKSLSAALIAEYLYKGIQAVPSFRFVKRKDGGTSFHILVLVNGTHYEDPSRTLGMGSNELKWFNL